MHGIINNLQDLSKAYWDNAFAKCCNDILGPFPYKFFLKCAKISPIYQTPPIPYWPKRPPTRLLWSHTTQNQFHFLNSGSSSLILLTDIYLFNPTLHDKFPNSAVFRWKSYTSNKRISRQNNPTTKRHAKTHHQQ